MWPGGPVLICAILVLAGCDGPQSVLAPGGEDAFVLANLFWFLLAGAVVLWCAMNGLMFYVTRINPRELSERGAQALILWGGIAFPTVVLAGLLFYALSIMPEQRAEGDGGLRVEVTGEQWWWRVAYWPEGADEPIISANEVRLPAGSRSEITLEADKVIHSFWVPSLGGKTDMIPGRTNRMSLAPTVPGLYRGQCAEYCGESHAKMAFTAEVLTPEDFAAWLDAEAGPAVPPDTALAREGRAAFFAEGCGACHAIRGTPAHGRVGPDLTHLASRATLAAGTLPMTGEALARWITAPESVKPGALMPGYDHLPPERIAAMAAYLEGLE